MGEDFDQLKYQKALLNEKVMAAIGDFQIKYPMFEVCSVNLHFVRNSFGVSKVANVDVDVKLI